MLPNFHLCYPNRTFPRIFCRFLFCRFFANSGGKHLRTFAVYSLVRWHQLLPRCSRLNAIFEFHVFFGPFSLVSYDRREKLGAENGLFSTLYVVLWVTFGLYKYRALAVSDFPSLYYVYTSNPSPRSPPLPPTNVAFVQ